MNITAAVRSFSEEELERLTAGPDATDEAGAAAEPSLSVDKLFHLLQNARRRAVIRYLRGREGPVQMRDVAEQVAAWEQDTTVDQLTSTERQRVYTALYQSHLETLAEAGVIAYNKPRGIIEPQPLLDRVAVYVTTDPPVSSDADGISDPWLLGAPASTDTDTTDAPQPGRYPGAARGSTLLLLGAALELSVVAFFPEVTVGVLILLLFTGVTVAELALDGGEPTEARGVPA